MGFDTDGTEWRTVRYTIDVEVMADNDEDAIYFADLALPDYVIFSKGYVLPENHEAKSDY